MLIKAANSQLNSVETDSSSIDSEMKKQKEFAKEFVALDKKKREVLESQQYQEYAQQILSDAGIKSKIICQYIPTINRLINKFLGELDLFVSMRLDDQFNESFKSRHRDMFQYDNFSDGQKRRIDIAILFTWLEIAKAKNSISTNLLFLDEYDSVLDKEGAALFLSFLKTMVSNNVFVISHKADILADKVDHHIEFELANGFTTIV